VNSLAILRQYSEIVALKYGRGYLQEAIAGNGGNPAGYVFMTAIDRVGLFEYFNNALCYILYQHLQNHGIYIVIHRLKRLVTFY
jgi:hypothetical protein